MNYLNLPKPHGWLLWRGKKKAIANDTPLSSNSLLVVSGDEAYGYVTLSQPSVVNVSEFERLEDDHGIRRESRKLYWPDANKFYLHPIKDWQPFESAKLYTLHNNEAELVEDVTLTPEQLELIKQAERLPKTLVLLDEAVTLCDGKAIYCEGVTTDKLDKILDVTLDGIKSADDLPLYHLALVRIPRLSFKQKKSDIDSTWNPEKLQILELLDTEFNSDLIEEVKAMPYSKVKRGDEWCVIQSDTEEVKNCYDGEDAESKADDLLASLRINVESDEGKSVKALIAEARKCYYDGMAMPITGPVTFAELEALEEAQAQARETQELTWQFQMLSSNILSSDMDDKASALATLVNEYGGLVNQAVKSDNKADELVEDDLKVGKRIKRSMKDRLKQAWDTIKEVMDWAEPDDLDTAKAFGDSSHFDVKQVNGVPWFIAYSANAFEDREGEIFSTKSLEKYVAEADKTGDRGFFNLWHIGTKTNPGLTDFARIEWQGVVGKFLVEAGPFLDNELGQAALKFFSEYPESHPDISPEGWGSSVEYKYLPRERATGIYENIWKTRTSTLPRKAAANTWTKGTIMALSPEQTQAAKTIFGEDLAAQIIKGAEGATKELEDSGVASKEVTTEVTTTETVTEVPAVESIAEQAAKLISVDFQPIAEALTLIADNQAKYQQTLEDLTGRIKSLEKTEDVKTANETSRFMVSVMNRASQADKTVVSNEDPLKNQKPVEQQVTATGAAAFFPAR